MGCCRSGKVSLPKFRFWPSPLVRLIRFNGDVISNRFMRLIRQYNSMFCFTSLGAHIDNIINVGGAPYVFKMNSVNFLYLVTFYMIATQYWFLNNIKKIHTEHKLNM